MVSKNHEIETDPDATSPAPIGLWACIMSEIQDDLNIVFNDPTDPFSDPYKKVYEVIHIYLWKLAELPDSRDAFVEKHKRRLDSKSLDQLEIILTNLTNTGKTGKTGELMSHIHSTEDRK